MTPEEANKLIQERLKSLPEMRDVIVHPNFKHELAAILEFMEIGSEHLEIIQFEILMVLTLYIPLSELGAYIAEMTDIPLEKAEDLANMVEATLLVGVKDALTQFDTLWFKRLEEEKALLKEESEDEAEGVPLPSGIPAPQHAPAETKPTTASAPLTRDDIMRALQSKRTMDGDIAQLTSKE